MVQLFSIIGEGVDLVSVLTLPLSAGVNLSGGLQWTSYILNGGPAHKNEIIPVIRESCESPCKMGRGLPYCMPLKRVALMQQGELRVG